MDSIEIVQAYFSALDSGDLKQAEQYLSEDYRLIDFTPKPMDRVEMIDLVTLLKGALPNLAHSLSNIRIENGLVKMTVQLSGTHSGDLDLRKMGIGIVPSTKKFIIFPNGYYEFTIADDKILIERDVSPPSPSRKFAGMLKALGVNITTVELR